MGPCRRAGETWNEHFCKIVEAFGDHVAIIEPDQKVTYQQLNQVSNRLARILRAEGVRRGQQVAIMMHNSIEAVVAIIAVLKAGGAYVPINPKDAPERKKIILEDSASAILIAGIGSDVNGLGAQKTILYEEMDPAVSSEDLSDLNVEDDYAYLLYTSGSTGEPKGAIITHKNICMQMDGITRNYGFQSEDVWTQFHTICFDFSVLEIFGCLYSGASLVIVPEALRYSGRRLMDFVREHRVTVLGLVPSVLYRIPIEAISGEGLRVHTLILGGEKLSFAKLRGWFETLPQIRIVNGYGLTETTIFNMGKTITKDAQESETSNIGQAFYPNQVCIAEGDRVLGVGKVGDICLGGPAISVGYWKNDRLNQEKYVVLDECDGGRFFRTGDLGQLLDNGDIAFIGRADNQVKIRGFRVEIEEIENKLRCYAFVKDLAVKVSPEAPHILCFAVLKAGDTRALQEYAVKNLPPYMVPERWISLDELPLTERGKVDKSKLTVDKREGFIEAYVPCTTEAQRAILTIWQEDFPNFKIGVNDSYYELGGNSLSVMNMLEQIGERYGTEISLLEFVQEPTIFALSNMVERSEDPGIQSEDENLCLGKYQEVYPMMDLQQAFFVGRQADVELGNCASHSYAEILCRDYDADRFRQVLEALVERHEMLRCRFDEFGSHHIDPSIAFEIPVHDLSMEDEAVRTAQIRQIRSRMENVILDYTKAPLARVEVSLMDGGNALIHLYLDALIAEGWSHELLLYEADMLYCGKCRELPALAFRYGDFVAYNERLKETEKYQKARAFWLGRLATLPGNPMLPLMNKKLQGGAIESEQERKVIRWETWRRVEAAANAMGLSVFVVSLTAFCKVIARYSKNQRFVINLPVSNRPHIHQDIDGIVGVCSNFFLFDFENLPDEPLTDTAKRVQKQMWALRENDAFNGNEIIREIYKESGKVGSFVATIVFTSLLDIPFPPKENLERVYLETHTSQIWMDTVMMSDGEGVSLNCDFVKGLLDKALVGRMMNDCTKLLEGLAVGPSAWEQARSIEISERDRAALEKYNACQMELPDRSVMDLFLKAVKERPEQMAIGTERAALTYRKVYDRVLSVNKELAGIKRGEAVAVVTNKAWYQVVAVLAILSRGGCYVPIDESFPQRAIEHCMHVSGANLCLTDRANWSKVHGICNVGAVDVEELDYGNGDGAEIVPTTAEDLLAIIFTSGTTGRPKGIRLKQRGVLNSVWFTNRRYHVNHGDRALALTSLCHDMSMYDLFGMIAAGGTIVIPEKDSAKDPQRWLGLMKRYGVTVFNSVPAFGEMLFTQGQENVGESIAAMRLVIHGGDFLKPSLAKSWMESNDKLKLVNVGGPTETSLWSIYHDVTIEEIEAECIPYGRPIANMKHYIVNDILEVVPVGVVGTIYSEGVGLAEGYAGQPELTEARFIERGGRRLFQTGDLGYFSADGEMIICGREDNQIKINGKRIELEEIEKHVHHIAEVEAACVVYQEEKKQLVTYYTGACQLEKTAFQEELEQELPSYMLPSLYIHLDALPLTRSGKVDHVLLKNKSIDEYFSATPTEEVYRDALEEEIYCEAARLLGRTYIERGVNFFMEGGNSILAIRFLAYMKQKYSISIGLGELFVHPCMDAWHGLFTAKQKSEGMERAETKGPNRSHIPLSPAQTGIWFYEQANHSAKYTVCTYIKMKGNLETSRLKAAIGGIWSENEVFRLNYDTDEMGMPYQFINLQQTDVCIEYVDVKEEAAVKKILEDRSNRRLDIRQEPLCQFMIVRVHAGAHYLITIAHHLCG